MITILGRSKIARGEKNDHTPFTIDIYIYHLYRKKIVRINNEVSNA